MKGNTLRVMTYNVKAIPSIFSPVTSLSSRRERVAFFVKKIVEKYEIDVLIIQEMFEIRIFEKFKNILSEILPYNTGVAGRKDEFGEWNSVLYSTTRPFHLVNGGVCIFSKYMIAEKHQLVFKNARRTCSLSTKGACLAVLNKDGRMINMVGAHLQAYGGRSMEVRKRQYLEMLNWLEDLFEKRVESDYYYSVSRDSPIIMGGDFNTCCLNYKKDFDEMFSQGKREKLMDFEFAMGEGPGDPTLCTITNDYCKISYWEERRELVDYIMVGPGVKVVQPQKVVRDILESPVLIKRFFLSCCGLFNKEVYNASDHYPVYSVLSF